MHSDADALYPPTVEPSEPDLPLHRFLPRFIRNPLRALPSTVYEQPIVTYRPTRNGTVAWVMRPDLTEQILRDRTGLFVKTHLEERVFRRSLGRGVLTSEGQEWQWQRRVLAPLFRHSEILSYVPRMTDAASEQIARWRADPSPVKAVDNAMVDTTFTVIANTMLTGGEPAEGVVLKTASALYLSRVPWEMAASMLKLPEWLPHPGTFALARSARQMRQAIADIIQRRRSDAVNDTAAGDLLGRLLAARNPETGEPMSDAQLIDNLLTLLEAGHETTARALTWSLYLIARAQTWQQRIRDEVSSVAGTGRIGPEHIDALHVTERVVKEAMRLYPPAPVVGRRPTRDIEIEGHKLPADTEIVIPMYAIHRHKALWDDPARFDPDRFLPEHEEKLWRTQYMPFGGGPRICLGMSFAMVEAKALLANFVRAARFEWDGRHEPEPISRITLRPRGGMPLIVTPL